MPVPPPHVPDALLSGWRLAEDATATPYDGAVTVTARTLVYEDADLRARVRDAAGDDLSVRFFLASRVRVSPLAVPASLLRTRVARESAEAFAARLRDAGVHDARANATLTPRRSASRAPSSWSTAGATRSGTPPSASPRGSPPGPPAGSSSSSAGRSRRASSATALSTLLSPSSYRADLAALMEETRVTDSADRSEG